MLNKDDLHTLWTFKYEPTTLDEMILAPKLKETLQKVIETSPNIILSGPPGVGKSCFTKIYLNTTGYDYIQINASDENNVETIRSKIKGFALSLGMSKYKIVYLNEMDYLSNAAQASLRQLMEDVHEHTRFVLTCNYIERVSEPLLSRCQHIEFKELPAASIALKCKEILEKENIEIDDNKTFQKSLIETIKELYPDIRRIINTLEKSVINKKITTLKKSSHSVIYQEILQNILNKDLDEIRKKLRSNPIDFPSLYNFIYENVSSFSSPGDVIIEISEHLYRDNTVAIKEINFIGMVTKLIKYNYI